MGACQWLITLCFTLICTCCTDANENVHIYAQNNWNTFQSPNYPNDYPNDITKMHYLYTIDSDHYVCVEPVAFDLEDSVNCTNDYLSFQNSMLEDPVAMWCGTNMTSVCSEDYTAYMWFHSNNNVTASGFRVRYRQLPKYPETVSKTVIVLVVIAVIVVVAVVVSVFLHRRWKKQSQAAAVSRSPAPVILTQTPVSDNSEKRYQDPPPSYDSLDVEAKQ